MCEITGFWEGAKRSLYWKDLTDSTLLIGQFIKVDDYNKILESGKRKILWCTELILRNPFALKLYLRSDVLSYGCIPHEPWFGRYKHPPYVCTFVGQTERYNNLVRDRPIPDGFCTLIARHDLWNTRTPAYQIMKAFGDVVCPSKLFNNYNNATFEREGHHNFLGRFKFNICSENTVVNSYVTEKLRHCILGGCIPIYCGGLDDIDKAIFNMDRILYYDPRDPGPLINKVKHLVENEVEFIKFYRQPVFNQDAERVLKYLDEQVKGMLKG